MTIAVALLLDLFFLIRRRRGYHDLATHRLFLYAFLILKIIHMHRLSFSLRFLLLGWFLSYAPYFLFNRALFLHHYLPSSIFGIMLVPGLIEFLLGKYNGVDKLLIVSGHGSVAHRLVLGILLLLAVTFFTLVVKTNYGSDGALMHTSTSTLELIGRLWKAVA